MSWREGKELSDNLTKTTGMRCGDGCKLSNYFLFDVWASFQHTHFPLDLTETKQMQLLTATYPNLSSSNHYVTYERLRSSHNLESTTPFPTSSRQIFFHKKNFSEQFDRSSEVRIDEHSE